MLKRVLRLLLPQAINNYLKSKRSYYKCKEKLREAYSYDLIRYLKYSNTYNTDSQQKLIGRIIRQYHIIEKGLVMPETRSGFGKELLISLSNDCFFYINRYNINEPQLKHALGVILEYEAFHVKRNFQLEKEIVLIIEKVKGLNCTIMPCRQEETTMEDYFKHTESIFPEFSDSRASIRNYDNKDISLKSISASLEIAKTTPSACNRQCWRTYVYTDKSQIDKILLVQGGCRGFGHLTNKLIIIAAETGVFSGVNERNQAYIDGGMYTMNLLYGLHYNKIATCVLNCSNSIEKDRKLREISKIKDSEVFIAMIACGIPPETFRIAISPRYRFEYTNTLV